ncbi:GNAT family N-acetyltransferase [Pseudofulvibacter geojedonensis]|uniref:GNAT family N-acetyltransferase n=1 Tax=Pseudofulvibacter geojedonensis TaxID=1123758 RepID=A0ABW3I470_9FLAO
MLTWKRLSFTDFSIEELYDVLQLRSEVFVVEQDCAYQDIDGKDQKALHILGYKEKELVAYTRCFKPNDYFKEASFGRVIIKESARSYGFGHDLIKETLAAIKDGYDETTIRISAQTYLLKFYESHGFTQEGEGYLEDGIPHVNMVK